MNYELHHGDCLEVMATMPANSVTAIVTDPPYGLGETPDIAELMQQWITEGRADTKAGFMNKSWDVVPGPVYWREMFRIAKPGAYLLAMCGTRTVDLMSIAIRFGGWVKFDEISYHMGQGLPPIIDWVQGAGFPKSMAIDKAIDRIQDKVGEYGDYKTPDHAIKRKPGNERMHEGYQRPWRDDPEIEDRNARQYIAATPEAAQWQNYGTALKPAHEIILCFRKPVDGTYANNALKWGTGGLNIDACRISHTEPVGKPTEGMAGKRAGIMGETVYRYGENTGPATQGRFPANIIFDGSNAIKAEFDKAGERTSGGGIKSPIGNKRFNGTTYDGGKVYKSETQSAVAEASTGSASRFFTVCPPDVPRLVYHAKASSSERNEGLDDVTNIHCTVKPLSLMQWLCRLVRQPANNLILDPFGGSGTTGVAALLEGCDTIIIEREADYIPIMRARLEHFEAEANMKPVTVKGRATDTADLPLFASF